MAPPCILECSQSKDYDILLVSQPTDREETQSTTGDQPAQAEGVLGRHSMYLASHTLHTAFLNTASAAG